MWRYRLSFLLPCCLAPLPPYAQSIDCVVRCERGDLIRIEATLRQRVLDEATRLLLSAVRGGAVPEDAIPAVLLTMLPDGGAERSQLWIVVGAEVVFAAGGVAPEIRLTTAV